MGDHTAIDDTATRQVAVTLASLIRAMGESVASYAITGASVNALTGAAAGNYTAVSSLSGSNTLTITPATLSGSIANQTKVYGTDDPSLPSVSLSGQVHRTVTDWMIGRAHICAPATLQVRMPPSSF